MRIFLNGYFEILKGKRHWASNYMIVEEKGKQNREEVKAKRTANSTVASFYNSASSALMSCDLMVFKTDEIPAIFTTCT